MEATFAFKFLIESVSRLPADPGSGTPSILFRLLDFPAVAISLNELSQQHSEGGCLLVRRGKACLFQSSLPNLVNVLHERMVRVELVYTTEGDESEADLSVKGMAFLDIHRAATALEKSVESGRRRSRSGGTERKELAVLDHAGKRVLTLHVKYQLTVVSRPESCDQTASSQTLTERSSALQRLAPDIKEEDASSRASTSDDNDSNQDLYLPNSVCPPPLFYHSESQQLLKDDVDKGLGEDSFKACTMANTHLHQESQSAVTQHWSALMHHDNSHPLNCNLSSLTRPTQKTTREKEEEETKIVPCTDNEKATTLPLLSALLSELTLLKSHVEPRTQPTPSELLEKLLLQRKVEMVSKYMQTDAADSTPSKHQQNSNFKTQAKPNNRSQNRKNSTARKFVRECCGSRYADGHYTTMVPKNKSVLYPPDIAHKRTRKHVNPAIAQHKNKPLSTSDRRSKDLPQQKSSHHIRKAATAEKKQSTIAERQGPSEEIKEVKLPKSLEVFIPQASFVTATSPLSGSRSSVCCQEKVIAASSSDVGTQTCIARSVETQTCTLEEGTHEEEPASETESDSSTTGETRSRNSLNRSSSDDNPLTSPPQECSSTTTISQAQAQSHDKDVSETVQVALNPVNIVVTKPQEGGAKREFSLSQEQPTPPRNKSTDNLPLLQHYGRKQSSLLNIASQTLDSFMSTDSLDGITSAVLPAHRVLYLATSQSTSLDLTGAEGDNGPPGLAQDSAVCLESDALDQKAEYSSLSYSDDFEEFESDSGSQSSSQ